MFFILSKLLDFLINPLFWVFIFIILSFVKRWSKHKNKFIGLSLFFLFFFTNPLIIRWVTYAWNTEAYTPRKINQHYDIAIVLGGFSELNPSDLKGFYIGRSGDRLIQALKLKLDKKVDQLFISGGSGFVFYQDVKEGEITRNFLTQLGLDSASVALEDSSRNTHENALFTYHSLQKQNLLSKRILLITSAAHMRRAMACFKKTGLQFTACQVDGGEVTPLNWLNFNETLIPNANNLDQWNIYLHEITGYLTYKLAGYI